MVRVGEIALERRGLDLADGQHRDDQRVAAERILVGADDRAALALDARREVAHVGHVDEALLRLEPR